MNSLERWFRVNFHPVALHRMSDWNRERSQWVRTLCSRRHDKDCVSCPFEASVPLFGPEWANIRLPLVLRPNSFKTNILSSWRAVNGTYALTNLTKHPSILLEILWGHEGPVWAIPKRGAEQAIYQVCSLPVKSNSNWWTDAGTFRCVLPECIN